MKIFIIFLLLPCYMVGQETPKGAYKIIVKNSYSKEDNFVKVEQALLEYDFQIAKKDKEFYTLESEKKHLQKAGADFVLSFIIKDSTIIVTGKLWGNMSVYASGIQIEQSFRRIENKGLKGSPYYDSFFAMLTFAQKLGTNLEFVTDQKQKAKKEYDDIYN